MNDINRGWARLAEAIIASGVKSNDKFFMESEWFEFLKDFVAYDKELFDADTRTNDVYIGSGNVMPKTVKKPLIRRNAQALAEKYKGNTA